MLRSLGASALGVLLLFMLCRPEPSHAYLIDEWAEVFPEAAAKRLQVADNPPAKMWREELSGMEFIWVEGGCYKMGSPPRASGRDSDEEPVREKCVAGFWMGIYEVTQAQWRTIMRSNPSRFKTSDDHPVERVNYDDAVAMVERLNNQYRDRATFSLPTEAQWEFACREGGLRRVYPGVEHINKMAWLRDNSRNSTQVTGSRMPNLLGLYDMSGNVWEWVQEAYDRNGYEMQSASRDMDDMKIKRPPREKHQGLHRVIRGGSWRDAPDALRCANRGFTRFSEKRPDIGLRLTVNVKPIPAPVQTIQELNALPF